MQKLVDAMVTIDSLTVRFGGVMAIHGLSLDIQSGEIFGIIGPNGAGKTTLFNSMSRLNTPAEGSISVSGKNILDLPRHSIVELGIARTFQNIVLYPTLTVMENVLLGAHHRVSHGFMAWGLGLRRRRSEESEIIAEARLVLARLGLEHLADRPAKGLPLGTMKRIELARALMSRPQVLMLDEPANGLTLAEVHELGDLLRALRTEFELTILLVEHHMGLVMSLCDRIAVLNFGSLIAVGRPGEIKADARVIQAYLGGVSDSAARS